MMANTAQEPVHCPALVISAPASGQGKTTVTAALAYHYRKQNKKVRVFKTGPDFVDPFILERASGHPVYQLDIWMCGREHCQALLYEAVQEADLILIEGVMGLFDGQSSTAELATLFGVPVLAVIDASAMAQTFAAVAYGLSHYQPDLEFAGVFANRVGNLHHYKMLTPALHADIDCLGWLPGSELISLPERHLGLHHANEVEQFESILEQMDQQLSLEENLLKTKVKFDPVAEQLVGNELDGITIAIAEDAAFTFLYKSNIECLIKLGAHITYFSPLTDKQPPGVDALYFPGGYPELYLTQLSENTSMHNAIKEHHANNKPIVAECGGMLYLCETLTDHKGTEKKMVGILPAKATMRNKIAVIAYQYTETNQGNLRGHSFHFSTMQTDLSPAAMAKCPADGQTSESIYKIRRLHASYTHHYFYSNPAATAGLFLT